jgi:signal transduction histidine kinase
MSLTPEQRIAQLEAELAAQRAEMQDFTYTVSHDLRASLRHIISYARLVQEDAGPHVSSEVQGFLATLTDSAKHMGVLMDGLMELSRLGTLSLHCGPVSLEDAVQSAHEALNAQYPERQVQWRVTGALPVVWGDAALVTLAVRQVLDNAVKFTAHAPQAEIDLSAQADSGQRAVRFTIKDNGAGYNPALQASLFKPFQRLHTAKQFPGIGMGLALSRKAMQRMDGTISLQGQVDQGCTVELVFRAA